MGLPSRQRIPGIDIVCTLAVFSLATGACIPRGDPPAGRQIVADRNATLLALVPPNGDGVLRALFSRPGKTANFTDLYVVSVDSSGGAPIERLLMADGGVAFPSTVPRAGGRNAAFDARGRLFVTKPVGDPATFTEDTIRVDPVAGETRDFGVDVGRLLSPSGLRLVITDLASDGAVIYEADDSATPVDGMQFQFVGEVLFYVTVTGDFMRVVPGGTPERLATGLYAFQPVSDGLMLLMTAVPDLNTPPPTVPDPFPTPPAQVTATLLDTTSLAVTALPDGFQYQNGTQFSPDGRWFGVSDASDNYILYDRQTGTEETLEPVFSFSGGWRPGHDELWGSINSDVASSLLIKRPGQPVITVPVQVTGEAEDDGLYTSFTADGAFWFSTSHPIPTVPPEEDHIGAADDPTGPRIPLVPDGSTCLTYWRLADGRFLVASYTETDAHKNFDVRAVDPLTGAAQPFGERGFVTAVGQTRFMGIFQVGYERGDLTTFDLASGRSTALAPEFAMEAFAEPRGADPYPPGGRIVYQYQARFDSPWDGLWLEVVQ